MLCVQDCNQVDKSKLNRHKSETNKIKERIRNSNKTNINGNKKKQHKKIYAFNILKAY